MQTCDNGHDEVCYQERTNFGHRQPCPVCQEMQGHKDDNATNDKRIGELQERIAELEEELASIRDPLVAAVKIANEERTDHEK